MGKKFGIIASSVDEYLGKVPDDARELLQRLRDIIKSEVSGCKERISYKIPIVSLNHDLVGFSFQTNHCSFHTMSPPLIKRMRKELKGIEVSGATIHFKPSLPLSEELIKKIVMERLKEITKNP